MVKARILLGGDISKCSCIVKTPRFFLQYEYNTTRHVGLTCYLRTSLCHVHIICYDSLHGSSSWLCNWLSLWYLMPWINRLPLVWWSSFWESSLKWWRVFLFGIGENNLFIVLICLYVWYIYDTYYIYIINVPQCDKSDIHLLHFHVSNMFYKVLWNFPFT